MTEKDTGGVLRGVEELLAAVAAGTVLPVPAERVRLREAAGLTQAAVAQALQVRVQSIQAWEAGRAEPKGERLEAYRRLLDGLAQNFPAPAQATPAAAVPSAPAPSAAAAPETRTPAPADPEPGHPGPSMAAPRPQRSTAGRPAAGGPAGPPAAAVSSSRGNAKRSRAAAARPGPARDPRFSNGPLLVLDGDGRAYGIGGLVLDCPATSIPKLAQWTLEQARIGTPRLHPSGKDGDPLVVLTASAAERLGLPPRLADRIGLRLPETHPVVKEIAKAGWKLTRRGFGPWARVYLPLLGGQRRSVQLAIVPWDALDARMWGEGAEQLTAPELAQIMCAYATRVITHMGSAGVCGAELMAALRPPPGPFPSPTEPVPSQVVRAAATRTARTGRGRTVSGAVRRCPVRCRSRWTRRRRSPRTSTPSRSAGARALGT